MTTNASALYKHNTKINIKSHRKANNKAKQLMSFGRKVLLPFRLKIT